MIILQKTPTINNTAITTKIPNHYSKIKALAHQYIDSTRASSAEVNEFIALCKLQDFHEKIIPLWDPTDVYNGVFKMVYRQRTGKKY
jgi:hypothetical protein